VYTPSENIVYSESDTLHPLHHSAGHGANGERKWPPNDSERQHSHVRMKVLLGIHHGIDASSLGSGTRIAGKISTARANLGIYGMGQRRSIEQLLEFTGIALPINEASEKHGNEGHSCANLEWVPYDASISPRANLFDGTGKADDTESSHIGTSPMQLVVNTTIHFWAMLHGRAQTSMKLIKLHPTFHIHLFLYYGLEASIFGMLCFWETLVVPEEAETRIDHGRHLSVETNSPSLRGQ